MEQKDTRQQMPQETIWKQFAGKRIILAGNDHQDYQAFLQNLVSISSQMETGFRVFDGLENVQDGDYILLFARTRERERFGGTEEQGELQEELLHPSWEKYPEGWQAAQEDWAETLRFLELLQRLGTLKPESVLLVSGNEVYGTCFGAQRALKEEELGYVCHTDYEDVAAQCMRTAEHFACRLAREEQIPLKIARIGSLSENEAVEALLTGCMEVLLYGENGEIYNLSGENRVSSDGAEQQNLAAGEEANPKSTENSGIEKAAKSNAGSKIVQFRTRDEKPEAETAEPDEMYERNEAVQAEVGRDRSMSGKPETDQTAETSVCSPLAPIKIVTDTRKSEKLGK